MPKRRANGEGNIRKRKDGRWEGRYTVGHDPETGKAIIKNVLGKTQAEVKEKLKKAIEENVGIDYGRAKTYTVGSWLEVWMENYAKVKLRPSTFKTSARFSEKPHQAADRQHPAGRVDFSGLAAVLQAPAGRRAGRPRRSQEKAERVSTENRAKHPPDDRLGVQPRHGAAPWSRKNPTQGCALPKVEHKEMKTLTADQLSAFFREARDSGVYELYYLDLATGLRRGRTAGTEVDGRGPPAREH